MKKANMFVVCSIGWEYNDETYNREDGGNPTACFTFEQPAIDFALEKNAKEFRSACTYESFGGFVDYNQYEDLSNEEKAICEKFGISDTLKVKDMKALSDSDIGEIMKIFNLAFYEVVEVDLYV